MAIRKFWIINGNNDKYDLTNANLKINIVSPMGLGYINNLNFLRIGNRNKVLSKQYSMPVVSGNIYFYDSNEQSYQNYNEFVSFLSKEPLKLFYQPPNTLKTYYIDCEVQQLDKSENKKSNILDCPIIFAGLSFWKSGEINTQIFEKGTSQVGKSYPLVREYSYSGSGYSDMPINNNNTATSPFIFEIIGNVVNPILSFYQNEERYGVIKLIGDFDYVRVNTESNNQELYLEKNGLPLSNPISYQDLTAYDGKSDLTFFDLRTGNNLLTFNADNEETFDGELKMIWEDEFVSV